MRYWIEGNQTDPALAAEQALYLANPLAFWNRPDGDYLTDAPYQPVNKTYDSVSRMTLVIET